MVSIALRLTYIEMAGYDLNFVRSASASERTLLELAGKTLAHKAAAHAARLAERTRPEPVGSSDMDVASTDTFGVAQMVAVREAVEVRAPAVTATACTPCAAARCHVLGPTASPHASLPSTAF